jgi:hypothetical protein
MLILCFWTPFWEPLKAAYLDAGDLTAFESMSSFEWIVDMIFLVDIMVNFVTSFERGFVMVKKKRAIAMNYLRGWFFLDLVATFPIDLLVEASSASKFY